MKLLIIAQHIGPSPTGFVCETLLREIIKLNPETTIICEKNDSKLTSNIIEVADPTPSWTAVRKLALIASRHDLYSGTWVRNGFLKAKEFFSGNKPEVVLSLSSAYALKVHMLASTVAAHYSIPLAVHSTDPVPSTPAWGEHPLLRNALASAMRRIYKKASLVSASNDSMLRYQIGILKLSHHFKTAITPNPPASAFVNKKISEPTGKIFLFLGSFYNQRTPYDLLNAFNKLIVDIPEATLMLVGQADIVSRFNLQANVLKNVTIVGWTTEPEKVIDNASVLIDIDANIPNDVFISSKLTNYLHTNRPVVLISPEDSPSRKLVARMSGSVFVSHHNEKQIMRALKASLVQTNAAKDREAYQKETSPAQIGSRLFNALVSLTNPE